MLLQALDLPHCSPAECLPVANMHVFISKNAHKIRIFCYFKYQKILKSSIQDMSRPWIYTVSVFSNFPCFCLRFLIFRFSSQPCSPVPVGQIAAPLHMGKVLRGCFVFFTDLEVIETAVSQSYKFHRIKTFQCSTSSVSLLIWVRDAVNQVMTVKI